MKDLFSRTANVARTFGAATLLATSSVANSDEALIPPGTTLGQFPSSSIPTLQNAFANQIVSDITPDPALVPSNTFRWLLVKTDSGLSLTLPENYLGAIQHFGQQEKFFVRFDRNTGLPEISFDLQNWQPYASGTPVNISREEKMTIAGISADLQALNTLRVQQQTLATTLAEKQGELAQVQDQLDSMQTDLIISADSLAITESNLSSKEGTKATLETAIQPEARLRSDTHPVVENTALDDTTKTSLTQTALNTYDTFQSAPQASGQFAPMSVPPMYAPTATFVPPTSAEVQATVSLLTQELSRIQTQINTVNAQITAKQNEINTTQNSIDTKQAALDPLEAQLQQYLIDYHYWDDEVTRLRALRDDAQTRCNTLKTTYASQRTRLMSEGSRNDVPSDLDVSNITSQINALKTIIMAEHNAIPVASNSWPTDTTTSGKADQKSTTSTKLDSSYYFFTDFYSSVKSYPAKLETWFKPVGYSSYAKGSTVYTVYSQNHLSAILSNTALPKIKKLCDYTFVDKVLETTKDDYLTTKSEYETYKTQAADATWERTYASNNINSAGPLIDQYKAELEVLNQQKITLAQQQADLETLKNTKAQLQTLYNRVKTILDQLQQHIASHSTVTQEIANLVAQAQALETEIANLEIVIAETEGNITELKTKVGSLSDDITTINTSLTATEQALLATLSSIATVIPQDSFSRNGAILTPSSEALKYFSDGFRTGRNARTIAGLPVKWMIQYFHDGPNDLSTNIYPATASVQYLINGRAYYTEGQKMNNFAHKEFTNGHLEEVITKLNTCIALLNQYPAESSDGIGIFLSELLTQISQLAPYHGTDTTIRNYVATKNTFTQKTLLQGGSYALFEHMLAHNAAFSLKIEQITDIAAQKGNIPSSADALNDLRHMMTTIMARSFTEKLMFSGTEGLNSIYANWEQEVLSFINGLGDTATLTNQLDMNADWTTDVHGNKYKFGLYHPAGIGNYTVPATLFMMYSPDGSNTQVLGPVQVASGAEADAMKARWQQELLKMKRIHASYKGGTYDIFRGTNEKGEDVYWAKYVFGGRLYQTGFQSGDTSTIIKYVETLLDQKVLASQRTSSYENQYDEIWAGYEYITALYANSITNYSSIQRAPNIILQSSLETLMYNQILELQRNYSTSAPYLTRIDNLSDRAQLYANIATFRWEKIRVLPDGPQKDAQLMQTKLISHEIMKLSILHAQIRAEMEMGIERVEAIKAGTETVLSFVPIVSTGVSLALLFDESKSLDEKAWELAGIIPIPGAKNLKYLGKIDNVVEVVDDVAGGVNKIMMKRPVQSMTQSVYLYGLKDINATRNALKANAKNWGPEVIDAIKANDPLSNRIDNIYNAGSLLHAKRAIDGRTVFLSEDRFVHLTQEIRAGHTSTRYEQLIDNGVMKYGDSITDFIDGIVVNNTSPIVSPDSITYIKRINGRDVTVITGNDGMIVTIIP